MSGVIPPPLPANIATGTLLSPAGELTVPRLGTFAGGITLTAGVMWLTYFVAQRTESIGHVTTVTGGTAAAGLTTAALGIYTVDGAGNLAALLASVSDLTMWTGTATAYNRAWNVAWTKQAGLTYALAGLAVGTTGPSLAGSSGSTTFGGMAPSAATQIAEAALPGSVPVGSLAASPNLLTAALLP
jgi:hypothetical protein